LCAAEKFRDNSGTIHGHKNSVEWKGKIRSAPTQGTLRAFNGKNQIRKTQCRVKSGVPLATNGNTFTEETKLVGWLGSTQATMAGAKSEISL
jgi:hypothetical protein